MTFRLALLGASGHGKVIADLARLNGISDIIFYDDRWQDIKELLGIPVVGSISMALESPSNYDKAIVSIGNARIRSDIQRKLPNLCSALIHPSAVIGSNVSIGDGSVIMANAVINADSIIGSGVIVNTGSVIEHDCRIDDFVHVCPKAAIAGNVHVDSYSWLGIGSSVIQQIKIGKHVTVGAGATVINDINDGCVVVGTPAKPLNR